LTLMMSAALTSMKFFEILPGCGKARQDGIHRATDRIAGVLFLVSKAIGLYTAEAIARRRPISG
jgi:hypothetical protein